MTALLALGDPAAPPDTGALDAPGGFGWWYFDLVTDAGDLLVIIAGFGLPFLPGRHRGPARARPSLNVAWYRHGRPRFHLLQEYDPAEADLCGEDVALGASLCTSRVDGNRRRFTARIDAPLPGTPDRLELTAELTAPVPRLAPDPEPAAGDHRWTPLAAGPARAALAIGGRPIGTFSGRGYHDRNLSRAPLDALGCRAWWWARAPAPGEERIVYVLEPAAGATQGIGLRLADDGQVARSAVTLAARGARWGRWGLEWSPSLVARGPDFDLALGLPPPAEDSPFYLRFHGTTPEGPAVVERVFPARIHGWHRPLVEMAVHRPRGPNSRFVGLFTGLDPGRAAWRRWLGGLRGGPEAG